MQVQFTSAELTAISLSLQSLIRDLKNVMGDNEIVKNFAVAVAANGESALNKISPIASSGESAFLITGKRREKTSTQSSDLKTRLIEPVKPVKKS